MVALGVIAVLPLGIAAAAGGGQGGLDPTFGKGGKVRTVVGDGDSGADALVIQNNGKLVAAGDSWPGRLTLLRYDADGKLDRSFGKHGKVTDPRMAGAVALVIQRDGKLVAAGNGSGGRYNDFDLVRYRPNGSPDGIRMSQISRQIRLL